MRETRSGKFVIPGEKLGVIEEFTPQSGTYEKEGIVYAGTIGQVLLDFQARKISVFSLTKGTGYPALENTVIGLVIGVQNFMVTMKLVKIEEKWISGSFTGVLHVSDVSFKYISNIMDAFREGDVVRAKVISDLNRTFHLTTKGANLGAVQSFCSNCGSNLILDKSNMKCSSCGNMENRKTSSDYGKEI